MDPITRTIPEQIDVVSNLAYIVIRVPEKEARLHNILSNDTRERPNVALPALAATMTAPEQAAVRLFLRMIVADGLNMPLVDVPEVL